MAQPVLVLDRTVRLYCPKTKLTWTVGQEIDIDTEDGWLAAEIVGPSSNGGRTEMHVRFSSDLTFDDWDIEDFRVRASEEVTPASFYSGELSYQVGGKGKFQTVWAELARENLSFRAGRDTPAVLLSMDLGGSKVGTNLKKERKGHPFCFSLTLAEGDGAAAVKYVVSVASQPMLRHWTACITQASVAAAFETSAAYSRTTKKTLVTGVDEESSGEKDAGGEVDKHSRGTERNMSLLEPSPGTGPNAKFKVGTLVDIETEDGLEKGVTILGPSKSGNVAEVRVRFADGSEDDWELADMKEHAELSQTNSRPRSGSVAARVEAMKHGGHSTSAESPEKVQMAASLGGDADPKVAAAAGIDTHPSP
jgi:hypothetical protein